MSDVFTSLPLIGWDRAGARQWLLKIQELPWPYTGAQIRPAPFTSGAVRLISAYSTTASLLEARPTGSSASATPAVPSP